MGLMVVFHLEKCIFAALIRLKNAEKLA